MPVLSPQARRMGPIPNRANAKAPKTENKRNVKSEWPNIET